VATYSSGVGSVAGPNGAYEARHVDPLDLQEPVSTLLFCFSWVKTPGTFEDVRRLVAEYVNDYNMVRLHSAIVCVTPADKLAGRVEAIWAAPKQKRAMANAERRTRCETEGFARSQVSRVH